MAKVEYKRGKIENLNDKNVPIEDGSIVIGYDKDSNNAEMYVDIGDNRYPVNSIKVDQTYNPESENAQSGKAVSQAIAEMIGSAPETLDTLNELANALGDDPNFATTILTKINEKPGEMTSEGGIVFGDYENNKALAPNSSAFGQNNIAGSGVFKILGDNKENNTMTLDSVEGLTVDMECSCQYNNNFTQFGKITAIDVENNTVTFDNIPRDTLNEGETNSLWVPSNPELGNGKDFIGTGAFSAGYSTNANATATAAFGIGNKAAAKYALVAGNNNVAGYADAAFGQNNVIAGVRSFGAGMGNVIKYNAEISAVFGQTNKIEGGTHNFVTGKSNTVKSDAGTVLGCLVTGDSNTVDGSWNALVSGEENTSGTGRNGAIFGSNNENRTGYNNIIAGVDNTVNTGGNSVVTGDTNILNNGNNNIITGYGNNVYANRCLISGLNNVVGTQAAPVENAIIGGAYAKVDSTTAFAIGNGVNANNPKNAITVNKDGSLNINEERFFANGDKSTSLRLKVSSKSDPTQEIFSVRHYSGVYNTNTTVMGRFQVKHHDKNMLYISEDTAGPLVESRRMFLWDTVDSYKNETKSPDSRAVNVGYLNHRLNEEVTKLDAKLSTVYKYKGSLEHVSQLDSIENPDTGDVYNVIWDEYNEGNNYAWTGTEWEALGSTIDLNNYADKSFVADYISDQGYATEDWVNANYLHYSERVSIASDGAFMAETHLEPRLISIEADMDTLSYKISNLPPIEDTYNPTSENAQSGKAVAEALTQFTQSSILNDVIMSYQFADKSFVDNHIDYKLEQSGYINQEDLRFVTIEFSDGTRIFMCEANNSEFIATEPIESLTIDIGKHEQDYENRENHNYINSVLFTVADSENVSITIFDGDTNEEPKYIGTPPDFKAGETWELNIKNGIVAAGKVGA